MDSDSEECNALEPQAAVEENDEARAQALALAANLSKQRSTKAAAEVRKEAKKAKKDLSDYYEGLATVKAWLGDFTAPWSGILAEHLLEIRECKDLRRYPLAHLLEEVDGKVRRVELGASCIVMAQHNTYVSLETKIIYIVLREDYDLNGEVPLTYNHSITEEESDEGHEHALPPGVHGQSHLCLTDMDVVDFKLGQPYWHWLGLMAFQIYSGTRTPSGAAVIRELARERCVSHVQTVRPVAQGLVMLAHDNKWKQLDETTVNLLFAMRPPLSHVEFDSVVRAYGPSTRAPFITRISTRCPASFQLAPNLTEEEAEATKSADDSSSAATVASSSLQRPNVEWTHDYVQHLLKLVSPLKKKLKHQLTEASRIEDELVRKRKEQQLEENLWREVIREIKAQPELFSRLGDRYNEDDAMSRDSLRYFTYERQLRQASL